MALSILRLPEVTTRTGKPRSSIYKDIEDGLFTHPVSIGTRAVGWPDTDVDEINRARIAGKTDDEIRKLVIKLEAARIDAASARRQQ